MIQTVNQTVVSARSAEAALVAAIDNATDALQGIATDPLAESLARLAEAAQQAQGRLHAGRLRARSLLVEALFGFETFEGELKASEPEEIAVPELPAPAPVVEAPAPVVELASELVAAPAEEVVVATAANGAEVEAPAAPLSPTAFPGEGTPAGGREWYDDAPGGDVSASSDQAGPVVEDPPAPTKKGRGRKAK